MLKQIKKLILLTLSLSLWALTASSQTTVLIEKDTNTCFTQPKAKFLLKEHFRANENAQLLSICELEKNYLDSIHKSDSLIIRDKDMLFRDKSMEMDLCEHEKQGLTIKLNEAEKSIRKQKVYKWLAMGAGLVLSSYEAYLLVKPK